MNQERIIDLIEGAVGAYLVLGVIVASALTVRMVRNSTKAEVDELIQDTPLPRSLFLTTFLVTYLGLFLYVVLLWPVEIKTLFFLDEDKSK